MSDHSDSPTGKDAAGKARRADKVNKAAGRKPEWANGLRKLYDSVVEEPLPDSFKDLLSRLDNGK